MTKSKLSQAVIFFGFVDLCYICWMVFVAITSGEVPFYSQFMNELREVSTLNDGFYGVLFVCLVNALVISVAASGIMMLRQSKLGVYISLVQAPFRLFLILPLTFFVVVMLKGTFPFIATLLILLAYILEIAKIAIQMFWLKRQ